GEVRDRAGEKAVDGNVATCLDGSGGKPRLFVWPETCRLLVVAVDRGRFGRRRKPRELVVRRRALRRLRRAPSELGEAVSIDPVRRREPCTAVVNDPQGDDRVLEQGRLVHLGAREP